MAKMSRTFHRLKAVRTGEAEVLTLPLSSIEMDHAIDGGNELGG